MALTGVLKADFSSFFDAVTQAEKHVTDMAVGADKAGERLNRMQDSFSGKKMIQDAQLMVEALERAGGASVLTASELTRVGNQAAIAVEKARALGIEIPPGLQKIAAEAKTTGGAFESMKTAATSIAGALGIGLSIGAVVNFGKSVFDSASQIHDMALQLGISAEAAQGFQFAADQSGSSIEAVGTALTKMNQHLATGDKSTVQALKDAGLGFADIRAMKPEDAFLAITDAVQQIPDPMIQSRVALELFGKGAAELLPGIKEGFRGVADGATKMSTDTIAALEHAQDVWESFGHGVTVQSAKVLAGVLDLANVWPKMTADLDRFGLSAEQAAKAPLPILLTPAALTATMSLDAALTALGDGLPELVVATKAADEAWKAGAQDLADAYQAAAQAQSDLAKTSAETTKDIRIDWDFLAATSIEGQQRMAEAARLTYDEMIYGSEHFRREALDAQLRKTQDLEFAASAMGTSYVDGFDKAGQAAERLQAKMDALAAAAKKAADANRAMGGSMAYDLSTKEGMDYFQKMNPMATVNASSEYFLTHTIEDAVRAGLINFYGKWATGGMPRYASGIQNAPGGFALVGERGPEIVNLPGGSSVLPFSAGGASGVVVQNTFHIVDTESNIAARVSAAITRSVMQGQRLGATR